MLHLLVVCKTQSLTADDTYTPTQRQKAINKLHYPKPEQLGYVMYMSHHACFHGLLQSSTGVPCFCCLSSLGLVLAQEQAELFPVPFRCWLALAAVPPGTPSSPAPVYMQKTV